MRVNVKHSAPKPALLAARALVARPENWIKGAPAKMLHRSEAWWTTVFPTDVDAERFCLDGALIRALCGPQARTDREQDVMDEVSALPLYTECCDLLRDAVEAVRDRSENVSYRWFGMSDRASHVLFNDHDNTKHADVLAVLDSAIAQA